MLYNYFGILRLKFQNCVPCDISKHIWDCWCCRMFGEYQPTSIKYGISRV